MLTHVARQQPLGLYFMLAYAISWTVWFVGAALGQAGSLETFSVFLMLGSFGPALAGLVLSALRGGWPEVQALLRRIIRVRVWWPVYVATWFVLPSIICLGLLAFGFAYKPDALPNAISLIIAMPINGLLTALFSPGPLGEEPGWRGVALPHMTQLGGWQADVLLGVMWAFWHVPVAILIPTWRDVFPKMPVGLAEWLVLYPISLVALAVMLSRLWRWSGGSVFICIWFHGVINMTFQVVDHVSTPYSSVVTFALLDVLLWVAAMVFVLLDRFVFERRMTPLRA